MHVSALYPVNMSDLSTEPCFSTFFLQFTRSYFYFRFPLSDSPNVICHIFIEIKIIINLFCELLNIAGKRRREGKVL